MRNSLLRNRLHILIWAAMLVYLPLSYAVHARYFVAGSGPVPYDQHLPMETGRIRSSLRASAPDRELMTVTGWAFLLRQADQAQYQRFIVLSSETHTYLFPGVDVKRPDIQERFQQLGMDLLHSGLGVQISKERIQPGSYRLGTLFQHISQDQSFFQWTNITVSRTPNYLKVTILE